jgi:cysteine-rich repeat protein
VSDRVPQGQVQTTRLPSGEFTNAWVSSATAYANTVSLCAPGAAVCGDGVRAPACERCDDGAANDDAIPDACRTTCLLPRCGDGVTDTGEECDDGNYTRCDGCGPRCTIEAGIVCGDGVTACGEQCDDGNGALLDGCTPACELEFAPGGGKRSVDCLSAWVIDNPTTVPPYDKNGDINPTQHCVDNDSRCDFDGGVPGSCGFRVQACGKTTSVPGCSTGSRLSSWEVHRPSEKQGAKRPWLAAVRASLLGVPGAIVGPVDGNTCSAPVVVTVPLRGEPGRYVPAKLVLQTRATSYEDVLDKDKLTLVCEPAS